MKIGLDIGSTTVKLVALEDMRVRFQGYRRHGGKIAENVEEMFREMEAAVPALGHARIHLAVSGSAGMGLAEAGELPFVQEVYATRVAVERLSPEADAVVELGGEDAKVLFLSRPFDARMNGSCAGGTGAFIDQMATLLRMTPAELNEKAKRQERIYTIASRCGVFAKTDVQPLINQGARVEDIAASILYSVVNQTVAGLAQGRKIEGRVLYLGGPLTYLSELRAAFDRILKIEGTLPENSLYYVAIGTALSAEEPMRLEDVRRRLLQARDRTSHIHTAPLFESRAAYDAFLERHARAAVQRAAPEGYVGRAHLGIDAGSTTLKMALIDEAGGVLHTHYQQNRGNPVPAVREALMSLYAGFQGMTLASVTVTGYGEALCRDAFRADYGVVETMAHFCAARAFQPEVDFIIDIGGQDMKCFKIVDGGIGDIYLNEACSSGCGSFLQTFAEAIGQDVESFSRLGLFADAPVDLGSRCTVFMNSSVKQAQKDGASIENISAGLSVSVVKNALYKVIRAINPDALGRRIVVQGGTFYNDAVLRAFEMELSREVVRPDIAGLMGAYGAALYGRDRAVGQEKSHALSPEEVKALSFQTTTARCGLCENRCLLTVNAFSGGRKSVSGNRCDRPVSRGGQAEEDLDLYAYKEQALESFAPAPGRRGKIGIPMVLNVYETLPFWHTLLTELSFEVIKSPRSSRKLYFAGQSTIPSDTVCYPAKLAHGHIRALCDREDIKTIFYPCMTYNIDEGLGDNNYNCPVVAYYPEVLLANCGELKGKTFIHDYVGIHRPKDFPGKLHGILKAHYPDITLPEVRRAAKAAYAAYEAYLLDIRAKADRIVANARAAGKPVIVLAGRPYHVDNEINHGIHALILRSGAAVVSEDSLSWKEEKQPANILNQWTYHARLFAAARQVCRHEDMQLVQLVSFGCGLDAVTTDEVREILVRGGKLCTQIKIDEIANLSAVNIRLRSLFAAVGHRDSAEDARADPAEAASEREREKEAI